MVSSATSAPTAAGAAARTRSPTAIPRRSASGYCAPTTSAAACAGCRAPSASPGRPSPPGSKKEAALPELSETLTPPDPAGAVALELDEIWSFVLKRAKKRWVWVALCRATRQVVAYALGDRSRATCQKLWAAIPAARPRRPLLHRLLGGVSTRHPRRAAHGRGQGVRLHGARRAVEQHAAPKARALRQKEPIIFKV